MQTELQGRHVIPGHGHCKSTHGRLRLTSKIGSEEKAADWFSTACPVSVVIGPAAWSRRPGDSDLSDISGDRLL
jgi:hypothetical protein